MQVWTFPALPFCRCTLKWVRDWKYMCIFIRTCWRFWEEGSSLWTEEVCSSRASAMLGSTMCCQGAYGESLAWSSWLWATWQSFLLIYCWWTQRLRGWAPHQLLHTLFLLTVRWAKPGLFCAVRTILSFLSLGFVPASYSSAGRTVSHTSEGSIKPSPGPVWVQISGLFVYL